MATETQTKVTLADFGPKSVWFASTGIPAGTEVKFFGMVEDDGEGEPYDLSDVRDMENSIPFGWDLEGTVNGDEWVWDGEGDPCDWNRNTVTMIKASH